MTAATYVAIYGLPTDEMIEFPLEVRIEAFNRSARRSGQESCICCNKRRRRDNIDVVHSKVPYPSDGRYQGNMRMISFSQLGNAVVLCIDCERRLKSGDGETRMRVDAYLRQFRY